MLSERVRQLILAGALGNNPHVRAEVVTAAQGEWFVYQARAIGIDQRTIDRMRRVAEQTGPMTALPNTVVWRAIWQSMIERAARGEAPIPFDTRFVAWADHIWTIMHGRPVRFEEIPHTIALNKALAKALATNP